MNSVVEKFLLVNLHSFVEYNVEVQAKTVEYGPFSEPKTCKTVESSKFFTSFSFIFSFLSVFLSFALFLFTFLVIRNWHYKNIYCVLSDLQALGLLLIPSTVNGFYFLSYLIKHFFKSKSSK